MNKRQIKMPRIGMRIIKSVIAAGLCYVVAYFRGDHGIVFYSLLSVLWCIQPYVSNTKKNAYQRTIGTLVGVLNGLAFLLIERYCDSKGMWGFWSNAFLVTIMIGIVLYCTVIIKRTNASYFSTVVFLSIVVNHIGDANPYLFVWDRFLDTMIGIVIGVSVNAFSLPQKKHKDVLFVSGVDDTLIGEKNVLSNYSKVELNRLIDDGAKFTLSTMRTPASMIEPLRDIRLKLPVICMDGAVLFDITENQYLKMYVISKETSRELLELMNRNGLHPFTNIIVDDLLMIYYDEPEDEIQKTLVKGLRKSLYRNYVKRPVPEDEAVVYFMLLYPKEVLTKFYRELDAYGYTKRLKILFYDSHDYPGYAYIKIYNKNATKENMIHYLLSMLGLEKTVTFGSIPDRYDVLVESVDSNMVVHALKKLYEPIAWPFYKK